MRRRPDRRPRRARCARRSGGHFRTRDYEGAANEFEAVVETHPVNDYAHFCLGRALSKTGETRRARHHLALASNLRPERRDYRIYRERLAARGASLKALVQRVSQAAVDVEGERVAQIGPGMLVLLGVSREDTENRGRPARRQGPGAADLRRRRGADERAARGPRGSVRQPVHPLRRHPQGQPAELHGGGARRTRPSRSTTASASGSGRRRGSSAPAWASPSSTTARSRIVDV